MKQGEKVLAEQRRSPWLSTHHTGTQKSPALVASTSKAWSSLSPSTQSLWWRKDTKVQKELPADTWFCLETQDTLIQSNLPMYGTSWGRAELPRPRGQHQSPLPRLCPSP